MLAFNDLRLNKASDNKANNNRVLMVCPTPMYPPMHGAGRRVCDFAKELYALGYDTTILSSPSSLFFEGAIKVINFDGIKYIETPLWHLQTLKLFLKTQYIQFEFPYFPYIMILMRCLGKRVVLDEHGVEYLFFTEMKAINKNTQKSRGRFSLGLFRNIKIVYLFEKIACKIANKIVMVSYADLANAINLYHLNRDKISIIPNCISMNRFSANNMPIKNSGCVLFVGSFTHPPNLIAVKTMLEKIVPLVLKQIEVEFIFVGRSPPPEILRQPNRNVRIIGDVEDVAPYIQEAAVAVCPIWYGSGTRLKILEYFAMGKPVVTTSKGIEGIEAKDGVNALIRDTEESFADAIVLLLNDKDLAKGIGEEGKKTVMEKYQWRVYHEDMHRLYR